MGSIPHFNPREVEERTQKRLKSDDINEKVDEERKGGRNYYSVYPPLSVKDEFTWDDLYKIFLYDVWNRFKSMNTFNVRHGVGYDPYNLRIERSVIENLEDEQKVLGGLEEENWEEIIGKMDERSDRFKSEMTNQLQDFGLWLNPEFEYDTRSGSFVDSIWWTVKELIDKDLFVKEEKPVNWCPRCKSPVVDTETIQKEQIKEKSLLKVPTSGGKNRFFLVEMEDPWKLPSGMTLAVEPKESYAVVRYVSEEGGPTQILMKEDKVEKIMERGRVEDYEVINVVEGEDLEGLRFKYPLYDKVPSHSEEEGEYIHKIICSEELVKDSEKGTGLVFLTPPHDEEHWKIAKEGGLTIFNSVAKNGHYDSGIRHNKYSGLSAPQSDQIILDDLESKNLLFSRTDERRKVKFCAACLNKIVKIPHREWFFKVSKKEDTIQNQLEDIDLIPSDEDLGLRDWIVTRKKRWGISFPLWRCDCGNSFVPSDRSHLAENSDFKEDDPPTPEIISEVDTECPRCGERMEWEGKILNPIFIQASSPWAQLGYPHSEKEYQSWWPGEIFITKHAKRDDLLTATVTLSSTLLEENCIKKMLMQGPVVSEIDYKDVRGLTSKQGYDSLRLYMLSEDPPWESRKIKGDDLQYPHPIVRVLWNLKSFLMEQIEKHEVEPGETTLEFLKENMSVEDEWFLSSVESTKSRVKESYKNARYDEAIEHIGTLVKEDLAQWYFSRAKTRLKESEEDDVTSSILKVLYEALISTTKMLVPISPFIAEDIYEKLNGKKESAFLCDWPEANQLIQKQELEEDMKEVKTIVEEIKLIKRRNDIPEKWPLERIVYKGKTTEIMSVIDGFEEIIKEKAKVKDIETIGPEDEWEDKILEVHPNEKAIGRVYQQWKSRIATMLNQRNPEEIKEGVERGDFTIGIQGRIIEIKPDMVTFKAKLPEGFEEIVQEYHEIYIDLKIYEDIWGEMMAKETMLRLKSMREDFDLEESDEIEAYIQTSEEVSSVLKEYEDMIVEGANVRKLSINEEEAEDIEYVYSWEINEEEVDIGIVPLYKTKLIDYYKTFSGVDEEIAENLYKGGFTSVKSLTKASASEISSIDGVKRSLARSIIQSIEEETEEAVEEGEEIPGAMEPALEEREKKMAERGEMEMEGEKREEEYPAEREKTGEGGVEEEPVEEEEKMPLPEGIAISSTYLVDERGSDKSSSFEMFKQILETGEEGLCVTRDYPDKIRDQYGLEDVDIIWLSNVDREDVIRPKSLEKFSLTIENFLTRKKGVILLNGLEYLITNNDFRTVLHLIQSIKDQVAINKSILMIPVNPTTLEDNQMDLLTGEVDEVIDL
ncbi:MAG: DUF835 domain-containing protein [Candidatus Thermoplasmatota archaeon]